MILETEGANTPAPQDTLSDTVNAIKARKLSSDTVINNTDWTELPHNFKLVDGKRYRVVIHFAVGYTKWIGDTIVHVVKLAKPPYITINQIVNFYSANSGTSGFDSEIQFTYHAPAMSTAGVDGGQIATILVAGTFAYLAISGDLKQVAISTLDAAKSLGKDVTSPFIWVAVGLGLLIFLSRGR